MLILVYDPTHVFSESELKFGITFDEYRQFINDFTTSKALGFRIEGVSYYNKGLVEKVDGDILKVLLHSGIYRLQVIHYP